MHSDMLKHDELVWLEEIQEGKERILFSSLLLAALCWRPWSPPDCCWMLVAISLMLSVLDILPKACMRDEHVDDVSLVTYMHT